MSQFNTYYEGLNSTGVRLIGPVGIGDVQMTTFFYRTKSLLKMSFWMDGFF